MKCSAFLIEFNANKFQSKKIYPPLFFRIPDTFILIRIVAALGHTDNAINYCIDRHKNIQHKMDKTMKKHENGIENRNTLKTRRMNKININQLE